jgi:tRNA uridine 5-carboxymethylaminomethyl modification enzyme
VNQDGVRRSALELLAYPGIDVRRLAAIWPELGTIRADVARQLEIEAGYQGYLQRQAADIAAFRREESMALPADLDFAALSGLTTELKQALARVQPATLGAAARIPGMTPAALTLLYRHARKAA